MGGGAVNMETRTHSLRPRGFQNFVELTLVFYPYILTNLKKFYRGSRGPLSPFYRKRGGGGALPPRGGEWTPPMNLPPNGGRVPTHDWGALRAFYLRCRVYLLPPPKKGVESPPPAIDFLQHTKIAFSGSGVLFRRVNMHLFAENRG